MRFFQVASEAGSVRSHRDFHHWLGGGVQHFLPHEILLAAWGDFVPWRLTLDLTSALPGVRTGQLAYCRGVDPLLRQAHRRWVEGGRRPVLLGEEAVHAQLGGCHCPIHAGLSRMRSLVVHGVHDGRSREESLFIAMTARSLPGDGRILRSWCFLDPLFAQIDAAFRRFPALRTPPSKAVARDRNLLDLSEREHEVMALIGRGRTNLDIAAELHISLFTVKNHLRRIFRRLGVSNRTQAAARYAEAVRANAFLREDHRCP